MGTIHVMMLIHQPCKPLKLLSLSGFAVWGLLCYSHPCFFRLEGSVFNRPDEKPRNGTPYYISPEVWEGKAFTTSSDVWSMGCILFEMCALQVPFPGNSVPEIAKRNLGPVRDVLSSCCMLGDVCISLFLPFSSRSLSTHIYSFLSPNSQRVSCMFIHGPHRLEIIN